MFAGYWRSNTPFCGGTRVGVRSWVSYFLPLIESQSWGLIRWERFSHREVNIHKWMGLFNEMWVWYTEFANIVRAEISWRPTLASALNAHHLWIPLSRETDCKACDFSTGSNVDVWFSIRLRQMSTDPNLYSFDVYRRLNSEETYLGYLKLAFCQRQIKLAQGLFVE